MSYVHVLRGGLLEGRHKVHAAVMRSDGSMLASVGDPNFTTFLRSSAKPFQAQALIPHLERFNLEARHLAIAMASHAGEDIHVATVADLQARAGIDPSWLICGIHAPFDAATRAELRAKNERPTVLHNNCSGKHSGMLAACLAMGLPTVGYGDAAHPLQRKIHQDMRDILETPDVEVAVDGCGVPCFRVPMHRAALGAAHLAAPESLPAHAVGLEAARGAMGAHPYLIAGRGRFDTVLMENVPGTYSKIGAEAFAMVGVESVSHGPLGIALKIEDGAERARDVAAMRILEQLGVVDAANANLSAFRAETINNVAGHAVGEVQPAFDLTWA
jgi:L-asparaginase II